MAALNFAVLAHINQLAETADEAAAEQLEIAAQCLSDAWGMDVHDEQQAAQHNPHGAALTELFAAGSAGGTSAVGGAGVSADSISLELSDKLAKFIHDISKKGFFDGVEVRKQVRGGRGVGGWVGRRGGGLLLLLLHPPCPCPLRPLRPAASLPLTP